MLTNGHFADRLLDACADKNSRLVVGLDPHAALLPEHLIENARQDDDCDPRSYMARAALRFNQEIIAAVAEHAVAVKPQLALYEQWGTAGWQVYEATVETALEHGLLVIADAKRNDIGSSAEGYAEAFLGSCSEDAERRAGETDAITVNPYFGTDGITPFLQRWKRGKGVFALVRTSNPSADQIQELSVNGAPLYTHIGRLVEEWGASYCGSSGYSALGAVVGATQPEAIRILRQIMPHSIFLLPGLGAQGASADDVVEAFDNRGMGAVVNSSRGILFAYKDAGDPRAFATAARQAALRVKQSINEALRRA